MLLATVSTKGLAQLGEPFELKINGVKVIVQPSGNEIVEVLTVIKGGVQNYPAAKAGIENLAMTALTECGTLKDDKNSFKNKLDKVSAEVGGLTGMDYASIRMNCIAFFGIPDTAGIRDCFHSAEIHHRPPDVLLPYLPFGR